MSKNIFKPHFIPNIFKIIFRVPWFRYYFSVRMINREANIFENVMNQILFLLTLTHFHLDNSEKNFTSLLYLYSIKSL